MINSVAPVTSVCFVCDKGRLSAQAVLLAASLRDVNSDVHLVAATSSGLSALVVQALTTLHVEVATIRNPLAPDYPIGNKLAALAAGWCGGVRVFMDSDILCLAAPDYSVLGQSGFAAKPSDIVSFGSEVLWTRLYRRFGLTAPAALVTATVTGELMYPYFNAGVVATTDARTLSEVWTDACRAIDRMADIVPRRPWLDQIGLPLAVARLDLPTQVLDESWNYPAHIRPLQGAPALVHYHLPEVVGREPVLRQRLAILLARYPRVASVIREDSLWATVLASMR